MIKKSPQEVKGAKRESQRKYRETHREQERERNRQWHDEHRDHKREYRREHREQALDAQRKYIETHADQIREQRRKYREAHKEAKRESQRKYRETHREQIRDYQRQYSITHPGVARKATLKHNYAITSEEADQLMIQRQTGTCAICGEVRGKIGLVIDHDHNTGEIRGVLCGKCNSGLGFFMDNSEWLRKAADYIEKLV